MFTSFLKMSIKLRNGHRSGKVIFTLLVIVRNKKITSNIGTKIFKVIQVSHELESRSGNHFPVVN